MIHDDERLGLEQRVGAKLALALALLEPEPLRLDHEIARGDGVGVDDRVLGQRVRLPLEHRQPVEPLERLLAPICAATAAWTVPAKSVTGRATTRSLRGGGRAPGAQSIAA